MVLKKQTSILSIGDSNYILLPSDIIKDSRFPFNNFDDITIKIKSKKLVVERTNKNIKEFEKEGNKK